MHLKHGAVIANKYRLERTLAYGGMGCIWSARHETLETKLAVKFIHPSHTSCAELRDRFAREAVASARISSPHVVQVFDYGIEDDIPYLVMELLEGEDLGVKLKREKRLSLEETCNILLQVAKGLRRAHEGGIVHRDLKPANIFIAQNMDDEVVKILDFGIAKLTSSPELTGTGQLVGSPLYMSPEQIEQSKSIDHRSDLWSLAVILFRAITGTAPFSGDDKAIVLLNVLGDVIPVPSAINPSLPRALDAFFERAFKREPSERFQSVREMTDAFVEAAVGEPPSASAWSVAGMCLTPRAGAAAIASPSTNSPTYAQELTPTAPAPIVAPAPAAASVVLSADARVPQKTLPSAVSLAAPPAAQARACQEKTTELPTTPSRRRGGLHVLWQLIGVSMLLGFGIGWQMLPSSIPASELVEESVAVAKKTGSSWLRALAEAHARQTWALDADTAPVGRIRPLDEPHSVLANDSVPASIWTPAPEPTGRVKGRHPR